MWSLQALNFTFGDRLRLRLGAFQGKSVIPSAASASPRSGYLDDMLDSVPQIGRTLLGFLIYIKIILFSNAYNNWVTQIYSYLDTSKGLRKFTDRSSSASTLLNCSKAIEGRYLRGNGPVPLNLHDNELSSRQTPIWSDSNK